MHNKILDAHRSPWTMLFHLIAAIVLGYGLWNHDWAYIIIAIVVAALSHMFPKEKKKR